MASFTRAPGYRVVGEALGTYIIVEIGGALWLIDKHAAHERVHFDRLREEGYRPMMQSLIEPVVISPGDAEAELLLDNAEMLEALGFSAEPFGGGRVAVRRIPTDIDLGDVEGALSEICEELSRGGDTSRRRDAILASVACKAAIKAGRDSGERELYELAGRVVSGEVRHCPHGRPVATELTKAFIDRSFKRT
jgi:DNA mismatch repair protein MutL